MGEFVNIMVYIGQIVILSKCFIIFILKEKDIDQDEKSVKYFFLQTLQIFSSDVILFVPCVDSEVHSVVQDHSSTCTPSKIKKNIFKYIYNKDDFSFLSSY